MNKESLTFNQTYAINLLISKRPFVLSNIINNLKRLLNDMNRKQFKPNILYNFFFRK